MLLKWQNVVTLLFIEYILIIQIKQIIKKKRNKEKRKRERETILRIHIKYVCTNEYIPDYTLHKIILLTRDNYHDEVCGSKRMCKLQYYIYY